MKRALAVVAVLALALFGAWFLGRPPETGVPVEPSTTLRTVPALEAEFSPRHVARESAAELDATAHSSLELPKLCAFQFADGAVASGLPYYVPNRSIHEMGITEGEPPWMGRLSEKGELLGILQRELPLLLCIQLSASALQTVSVDGRQLHVLEIPVRQTIQLASPRSESWAELEIQSRSVDRLWNATILGDAAFGLQLADDFELSSSKKEEVVIARARVRVTPSNPAIIEVPRGAYWIEAKSCSFGFDFDGVEAVLDGRPFTISLHPVPLTQVMLPLDVNGKPILPFTARVVERTVDPRYAESEGEIEVPFEVRGEVMYVAQTYRSTGDAEYTTYSLLITWWNGRSTRTEFGPWERLLENVTPEFR